MIPISAVREDTTLSSPEEQAARRPSIPGVDERTDFSLIVGGPLFQLLRRTHLSGDALELMRQRVIAIALLAWLPLLALSVFEGQALGGRAAVPFLWDVEANVRLLIALPLLIVAEVVVN